MIALRKTAGQIAHIHGRDPITVPADPSEQPQTAQKKPLRQICFFPLSHSRKSKPKGASNLSCQLHTGLENTPGDGHQHHRDQQSDAADHKKAADQRGQCQHKQNHGNDLRQAPGDLKGQSHSLDKQPTEQNQYQNIKHFYSPCSKNLIHPGTCASRQGRRYLINGSIVTDEQGNNKVRIPKNGFCRRKV